MTGLVAVFVVTLIATVVGTVLAFEAQAWAPYVTRRLLRKAFARFPGDLPAGTRARWMEEIEADANGFDDRPLGGLAFAFRLWRRGGRELSGELALRQVREARVPASSEATDEAPVPQRSPEVGAIRNHAMHAHHVVQLKDRDDLKGRLVVRKMDDNDG